MNAMSIKERVLNILVDVCEDEVVRDKLDLDLFDAGLLDSIGFIQFLVDLEDKMEIVITPTEVQRSDFSTPQKIVDYVLKVVGETCE